MLVLMWPAKRTKTEAKKHSYSPARASRTGHGIIKQERIQTASIITMRLQVTPTLCFAASLVSLGAAINSYACRSTHPRVHDAIVEFCGPKDILVPFPSATKGVFQGRQHSRSTQAT